MKKECIVCKIEYLKPINCSKKDWGYRKFCSRNCMNKYWIGKPNGRKKQGSKNAVPAWNKGKSFPQFQGENSVNWKGGITAVNQRIRTSAPYRNWRKKVFERDNYTCQECKGSGVTLQADHIKPFAFFPELRLVIENGRTLCVLCHRKTETYAGKIFKYQKQQ